MTDGIVTIDRLRQITGLHLPSAIERWLDANGIAYKPTRRGPVTTLAAIDAALGVRPAASAEMLGADAA